MGKREREIFSIEQLKEIIEKKLDKLDELEKKILLTKHDLEKLESKKLILYEEFCDREKDLKIKQKETSYNKDMKEECD